MCRTLRFFYFRLDYCGACVTSKQLARRRRPCPAQTAARSSLLAQKYRHRRGLENYGQHQGAVLGAQQQFLVRCTALYRYYYCHGALGAVAVARSARSTAQRGRSRVV